MGNLGESTSPKFRYRLTKQYREQLWKQLYAQQGCFYQLKEHPQRMLYIVLQYGLINPIANDCYNLY